MSEVQLPKHTKRLFDNLPWDDDYVLIVLKGHLLIEEHLDGIIRKAVANEKPLGDTRFQFFQKANLAHAMLGQPNEDPHFSAILKLNQIRNKLVHRLEVPQIEELVQGLISDVQRNIGSGVLPAESPYDNLRILIAYLTGTLRKQLEEIEGKNEPSA